MTLKNLLAILLVLGCVDAKQFGTWAADKSQKRWDDITPAFTRYYFTRTLLTPGCAHGHGDRSSAPRVSTNADLRIPNYSVFGYS